MFIFRTFQLPARFLVPVLQPSCTRYPHAVHVDIHPDLPSRLESRLQAFPSLCYLPHVTNPAAHPPTGVEFKHRLLGPSPL